MAEVSTTWDAERNVPLEIHEITHTAWAIKRTLQWFEVTAGGRRPKRIELAEWLADDVCRSRITVSYAPTDGVCTASPPGG